MNKILDLLALLPKSVQILVAGLLIGGIAFAAHEERYMTIGDYTKSYVLNLKAEIRAIRKDLKDSSLSSGEKERLQEQLQQLLDELCYESPKDTYCKQST